MRSSRAARWVGLALIALLAGCATGGPPILPAGIAELVLPADAATLRQIAADDESAGGIERRRAVLDGVGRRLLTTPPADALVAEQFDFLTALAPRMEAGVVSPAWGSYLYTTYQRDLTAAPATRARRTTAQLDGLLDQWIEFYRIRENPRAARTGVESAGFEATQDWRSERRLGR